jgi:putative PIN family toxin of toxin-antitoxin system
LDTNVLVSYLLFKESTPGRAVSKALREGRLLLSDETIEELVDVLNREKLSPYLSRTLRQAFLRDLFRISVRARTIESIQECRDPDDNKFLELAISGKAAMIVTGDADLLALHPFRGIPIFSLAEFLDQAFSCCLSPVFLGRLMIWRKGVFISSFQLSYRRRTTSQVLAQTIPSTKS